MQGERGGTVRVGDESGGPVLSHAHGRPLARVTAILVVREDAAPRLPRTLAAVRDQTRPPDRVVGVDAGAGDAARGFLATLTPHLVKVPAGTVPADAVRAALTRLDAATLTFTPTPRPATPAPAAPPVLAQAPEWLWLLHDDSAPAPDALELLLEAVDTGPSIGIAGCKQVTWHDPRRLRDVGFTTSRLGARVTGVDADDVDQGQLDHRSDVLAVSGAGMLVRRDVWDDLGGPDPAVGRDDLDLCRRAHQAGHRVVVVPRAVVAHAGCTVARRRPAGRRQDRRDALHLRLAATPWALLPLALLWAVAAAAARAAALLALKRPAEAGAEVAALALALGRPAAWLRAHRRAARTRRVPRRAYRRLLAPARQAMRQRRDALSAYVQEAAPADADAAPRAPADVRRTGPPPVAVASATAAVLGVAAVAALHRVVTGGGPIHGPALPPAPESAAELWRVATSGWRPVGLGAPGAGDPLAAGVAGLAAVLGGSTRVAVELLLVGALPLAALVAWHAAGAWTASRALRLWAALAWAAAPTLLVAVAAGRLGAVVAHVTLPAAALALARAAGRPGASGPRGGPQRPGAGAGGRRAIAAASAAGLLATVVLAGAPSLALPLTLAWAAAVALVAVRARGRRGVLAWAAAVPAVLLLPWWVAVARHPRLLLAEAGGPSAQAPPGAEGTLAWWHLAALPADPWTLAAGPLGGVAAALGLAPETAAGAVRGLAVAAVVPVALLALAAVLGPRRRSRAVAVSWVAALAGLAAAGLAPLAVVVAGADGDRHAWAGPGLSLWWLGLLSAALARADGAATTLRSRPVGVRHGLAVVTGVVAVAAPAGALGTWTATGATADPGDAWVSRGAPGVLPAVNVAEAQGPAATRTLVLRVGADGVRLSVTRLGPRFGDASAAVPGDPGALTVPGGLPALSARAQVVGVIGDLLSDTGADERRRLSDLGVGSVLLLPPVDDAALGSLDTAPGLTRVQAPDGAALWRVDLDTGATPSHDPSDTAPATPGRPSWARVLGADGAPLQALASDGATVRTALTPGAPGRRLVLAERADGGWVATLDGHRLAPAVHAGWAQAFELPAWGGRLVVEHRGAAGGIGAVRLTVAGLALLLAVPLPRRRWRLRPPPARATAPGAPSSVDLRYRPGDPVTWPVPVVPAARRPDDSETAVAADPAPSGTGPATGSEMEGT